MRFLFPLYSNTCAKLLGGPVTKALSSTAEGWDRSATQKRLNLAPKIKILKELFLQRQNRDVASADHGSQIDSELVSAALAWSFPGRWTSNPIDKNSPSMPGLSGSVAPGFSSFTDWCPSQCSFYAGLLPGPSSLAVPWLLGPSLYSVGPGLAPLSVAWHRPDPKSQFPARLWASPLFKTFSLSPVYLNSIHTLRSSSNSSSSKQSALTTLAWDYLLFLINLNL